MNDEVLAHARHQVLALLPHRAADLARLSLLIDDPPPPTVTVVGKYNHGKSRLLNELLGREAFAVADRRQTVALSEQMHAGVSWLDAPGLDADVASGDDRHAWDAVWLRSDIRLFVHAAKEGELDAGECALLEELCRDAARTGRQTLLVISQVDQLAGEAELDKVMAAIAGQAQGLVPHPVSATRHHQGVEGGKRLLLEASGIPYLKSQLDRTASRVPVARAGEARWLLGEVRVELERLLATRRDALESLRHKRQRRREVFDDGLRDVLAKVGGDLEETQACG